MTLNILLYGATGYTGELIAHEFKLWQNENPGKYRVVLGARDADNLRALASTLDMEYRVFGLNERRDVRGALACMHVVLNAAGPFSRTAERLAKVALEMRCHYVDINGEPDVYKRLDDLHILASQRKLAMISGAGFWAATSDWLLDQALMQLKGTCNETPIGSIRIVMSCIDTFSRGSVETVWRSLREQVTVVRKGEIEDGTGGRTPALVLWHEPVGKLERTFSFARATDRESDLRIATAASLVDTLTARLTAMRHHVLPATIESYVEADQIRRMAYQVGSMMTPLLNTKTARTAIGGLLTMLSDGPTPEERASTRHIILLEIEDVFRSPLIDWRFETPNLYQMTAQLAVAVATRVACGQLIGWCTPVEALSRLDPLDMSRTFRLCTIDSRT